MSTLLQAGITSGWDSTTINAIAYGPVLDMRLLPASLGGAEGFIAGSLEMLVTSYDANNSAFAEKISPILNKISDLIENTPKSVFDKLPENVRETLTSVKQKMDEVVGKVEDNTPFRPTVTPSRTVPTGQLGGNTYWPQNSPYRL